MNTSFKPDSNKYECDLVYIFNYDEKNRLLYKLLDTCPDADGKVRCKEIKTVPFVDPYFDIDCSPFGLYVYEYLHSEILLLPFDSFDGRAVTRKLLCGNDKHEANVLITLPYYWLFCYK